MSVPKNLLAILACPRCKGDVQEKEMFIICKKCKLAYPVLDKTVPDMLIDDAWQAEKARKAGFNHNLRL